jgi:Tfp pilus assembly protein PilO
MTRTQRWSAATAAVVVLILVASWMLLISPQRSHTGDLKSQADDVRQQTASLQVQINTLKSKADGVVAQQARIADIGKEIPDNPALASYVLALTAAAKKSGVDLQSISPAAPAEVTLAKITAPPAPAAKAGTDTKTTANTATNNTPAAAHAPVGASLSTIKVQLQVAGDYFQLRQFLSEIENLKRASVVTGITLAPGGHRTGDDNSSSTTDASADWRTLNGTVSLDIFMTNQPLAGAPTPAPSASSSK